MTVRPVRRLQEKRGWAFNLAVPILKPTLLATTRRTWIDGEKIPATGGCILVFNHVSHVDPLTAAHIVYDHGRMPRYLAKSGLFKNRALGYFLRSAGQIPVERLTKNAKGAFDAAVAAVEEGECVVVYPEGTITRDPDLWPMVGKSGRRPDRARDRVPGDPGRAVGRAGAADAVRQEAAPRPRANDHDEGRRPGRPRRPAGRCPHTQDVINQATDRIMAALTQLVEDVRGEKAPAERFDPRKKAPARDRRLPQARRGSRTAMSTIAVFGAGSWGTAFSLVLADAGNDVTLWARREEVCDTINRAPGEHRLPPRRRAAGDGHGDPRHRAGAGRRRGRGVRGAVADLPREPRGVGAVRPRRRR